MTTPAEAEALGREAFAAGHDRIVPRELIERGNLIVAESWYIGWDKANLAAPVDYRDVEDPPWPRDLQHRALLEGWDVWDSHGSLDGPYQIQFLAEPELLPELGYTEPKFNADPNVWVHVRFNAAEGSELHQRALLFIEHHNSLEYARIMRWPDDVEEAFFDFDPTEYQDVFPRGRCDGCGLGLTANTTHDEDACIAKGPQRNYWE